MLAAEERDLLLARCRQLPCSKKDYRIDDFVDNLLLTVLDYALHTTTVERAMQHFNEGPRAMMRTASDLKRVLGDYADDRAGNTELAGYLWGMRYWNRAHQLRDLFAYFESRGVTTQSALCEWALKSEFTRDFQGRIRGLSFAVYQWLIIRQGVPTIKPDVHVKRFVQGTIGRLPPDDMLVTALEQTALDLGLAPYELDWRIWEHQRGL